MKYSYNWLQKHIEEKLPQPEILKEAIIFHAFEVESTEQKNSDTIFDIKVLPDRAGDCLSHYGMAREIAGLLKLTLKESNLDALPDGALILPVDIKSDLCRRYIAIQMNEVTVGPSPSWLIDALQSIGQKSINNIVDATNYILFDTGQPTHAFDAAKVDGGITVRLAHDKETIITLSEENKSLSPDMLVITDYLGAIAIAGVKGGKTAEISTSGTPTTSVILEVANFDPTSVRKTARSLGLATDASKRFENNLSPEIAYDAASQLVSLIKEIAGGVVVGVRDVHAVPQKPRSISFTVSDIQRILGLAINGYNIEDVFDQYRYVYTKEEDQFVLTVPNWRQDIQSVADIAEEVGRVVGYDKVPTCTLPIMFTPSHSPVYEQIWMTKLWLARERYREVMNYTFCKGGEVSILAGAADKNTLRSNLSDAIKDSFELNKKNAPLLGLSDIKLFEIGTVFFLDREEIHVATVDKGLIQELPLDTFIKEREISLVEDNATSAFAEGMFTPWSIYPFITRDVAVWISTSEDQAKLHDILAVFAREYCMREPVLFDQFTKGDRTSVAYRLVFQSPTKTLTDQEVESFMEKLLVEIRNQSSFELR